jgi:uncharacterized protein
MQFPYLCIIINMGLSSNYRGDGLEKRILGRTGIKVTELCFGALPMGPLQKNLECEKSAEVVAYALRSGINFVDTAQMYKTYEPIRMAIEKTGIRPIIASKSNKKNYDEMRQAVNEALENLRVDYIDIFHLHAAREGEDAFEIFKESLRCLVDMKSQGKIRAIGISTHSVKVTKKSAFVDEIDIVFPIINMTGMGITDGTKEEMLDAIKIASDAGKGIYLMKALAGGNLINHYYEAMNFARSVEDYASVAVGMVNKNEVDFNIGYFRGENFKDIPDEVKEIKKLVVLKNLCKACGACMSACPNSAISFDENKKADVKYEKCLTCGYCTSGCPEFALRVV